MKTKNIIFILTDQQQRRTLTEETPCIRPAIDSLISDSVWFSNAYTVNAICSPARASFITGMLPHNHGMIDCTHTVPQYRADFNTELDTLPQTLKRQGYMTSYYGKWHIERTNKLENFGFDDYMTEIQVPSFSHTPVQKLVIKNSGYNDKILCGVFKEGLEATEEFFLYNKAIDFIEKNKNSKTPWCTFISSYAPHDPYTVPEEVWDMYEGVDIPLPQSFTDTLEDKPNIYKRLQGVWKNLSKSDVKTIMRSYYAYCTVVDTQIQRLTDYLKANNLYDDTLIVYLSDHGDMMGSHGLFCKGIPAFEEVYAIPLFIKLPQNSHRGLKCDTYANTHDIAPSVLDILGLQSLKGFGDGNIDGKSLVAYIEGSKAEPKYAFAEFFGQRFAYTQRILWKDNYKLVFNAFDYDEFYDLNIDPYELKNQINNSVYRTRREDMMREIWNIIKKTGDTTMNDAQYYVMRFAAIGPEQKASIGHDVYNKEF